MALRPATHPPVLTHKPQSRPSKSTAPSSPSMLFCAVISSIGTAGCLSNSRCVSESWCPRAGCGISSRGFCTAQLLYTSMIRGFLLGLLRLPPRGCCGNACSPRLLRYRLQPLHLLAARIALSVQRVLPEPLGESKTPNNVCNCCCSVSSAVPP